MARRTRARSRRKLDGNDHRKSGTKAAHPYLLIVIRALPSITEKRPWDTVIALSIETSTHNTPAIATRRATVMECLHHTFRGSEITAAAMTMSRSVRV
jgi:hypothetical protein